MPTIRKDYLERAIEQLVEALAALAGFRVRKDPPAHQQLLDKTCLDLLGIEFGPLTAFGPEQAAQLLGTPRKIWTLAQLVAEQAEARVEQGDRTGGQDRMAFALRLCELAREKSKTVDAGLQTTLEALEKRLAELDLPPSGA